MSQSAPAAANTFDLESVSLRRRGSRLSLAPRYQPSDVCAFQPTGGVGACRFPKLEECAHFHYERVALGGLALLALPGDERAADSGDEGQPPPHRLQRRRRIRQNGTHLCVLLPGWICIQVRSHVSSPQESEGRQWTLMRNRDNLLQLDDLLHR